MSHLTDALNKYGVDIINAMKTILEEKGKGDSDFIKTLNYKLIEDISSGSLNVEFIMEDYAKWLDEGRGPGKQPPLEVISGWCSRKGIPQSAAFPIARNIGLFGIPPTNFLDPIKLTREDLLDIIGKATAADIADAIRKENK